jgi:putative ABC transport system substrate-binding protein
MPETVRSLLEPALRDGLRGVGYVERQTIRIDWQPTSDAPDDLRQTIANLVRSDIDLVLTTTTTEARAVLDTTKTVPLVFQARDPIATGLVESLARPGGNATGVSTVSPDLTAKRLDLLRQLLPRANRVAVLGNPANPLNARHMEEARSAARLLRFSLETYDARDTAELDSALAAIQRSKPDAFLATADLFLLGQRGRITAALRRSRLPCVLPYSEFHDTGALMTYGYSLR